jgi:hypothetical protein
MTGHEYTVYRQAQCFRGFVLHPEESGLRLPQPLADLAILLRVGDADQQRIVAVKQALEVPQGVFGSCDDLVVKGLPVFPLATWAGPVRKAFDIPAPYRLICGVPIGYASAHAVNGFNPGRAPPSTLRAESTPPVGSMPKQARSATWSGPATTQALAAAGPGAMRRKEPRRRVAVIRG